MNNQRRKAIDTIIAKLSEMADDTNTVAEEEQEYRDNAPENMYDSEKYARAEEVAQELEEIAGEIEELVYRLAETKESM